MAAKKKPAPTTSPYVTQAQQAASLKYGPLVQALGVLQQSADSQYVQGRTQADSAARSIIAAADSAKGGLGDMLTRVGGYSGDTANRLGITSSSPLAGEAATQAANLGLSGQAAMAQLENAKVRGAEAGVYQKARARDQYLSDTGKIQDQYTGIQSQSGDYAASELEKLLQNAGERQLSYAKIRADNANSTADRQNALTIAQGHDQTTKDVAASKPPPKPTSGPGSASHADVSSFASTLARANRLAKTYAEGVKAGKYTTDQSLSALADGLPAGSRTVPVLDPTTGKPLLNANGTPRVRQETLPAAKGVGDDVAALAALEIQLHGGISKSTADAIRRTKGIKVADLGIHVVSDKQIAQDVHNRKVQQGKAVSGAIGQVVSNLPGG